MTTQTEISQWFDRGVEQGDAYMIVVCDTYEHDDYPVYVKPSENFWSSYDSRDGKNMQRIMEVYDLNASKAEQLQEWRTHRTPART